MKTIISLAAALTLGAPVHAQRTQDLPKPDLLGQAVVGHVVGERGANHRQWLKVIVETNALGQMEWSTNLAYVELATGLHYLQDGDWRETREEFEVVPGWALAHQGPHKVSLAYNLNTAGAVAVEMPDGRVMRSQVLALYYADPASGRSVRIAEIKDCAGKVLPPNRVLYEDAFDGILADVRFTYTKAGIEQDVILRQRPIAPAAVGLSADSTLTVLSEFIDPPASSVSRVELGSRGGQVAVDEHIAFGPMSIGRGKAFVLATNDVVTPGMREVPVRKRWLQSNGRHFLLEQVPITEIWEDLAALPPQAGISASPSGSLIADVESLEPRLKAPSDESLEIAQVFHESPGYVLDYIQLNGSLTNFTFQGDTTYYVTAPVNLYGTNYLEGGAVIKYTNFVYSQWSAAAHLNFPSGSRLVFQTSEYRPAVFTAKDDNSAGEVISGSTGNPAASTHGYGFAAIRFPYLDRPLDAHDLRICYSFYSLMVEAGNVSPEVRNGQFTHNDTGLYVAGVESTCRNLLFYDSKYRAIAGFNGTVHGEHLTLSGGTHGFMGGSHYATNSLFVGVGLLVATNWPTTLSGAYNGTNASIAEVFQRVGGGSHYLATNSPYRDAGTTNINPGLLAELKSKTTFPPLVYSNATFSISNTFSPQAARDTDQPDLGYHYPPLDVVFGGCNLSAALTVAPGTALAWFESHGGTYANGQPYGMALNNGATVTFNGTATDPVRIQRFNVVQEGNGSWPLRGWISGLMINGSGSTPRPEINARFTKWSGATGFGVFFRDRWNYGFTRMTDSELDGSGFACYGMSTYFTNCVFNRPWSIVSGDTVSTDMTLRNCTFYNGMLFLKRYSNKGTSFWWVNNTAFDGTRLITYDQYNGNTNYTCMDYNCYNPSNTSWVSYPYSWPYGATHTNVLELAGAHDLTVTNYHWQSGVLGDFHLPDDSALIEAGSTNADLLGLYHYTTTTNQVKEGLSTVDIGYHYVAVDGNGIPLDTDLDGLPDYHEDTNGNGNGGDDPGNWLLNSYNGLTSSSKLQVFTPLRP